MKLCLFLLILFPLLAQAKRHHRGSSEAWVPFVPTAENTCQGEGNDKGFVTKADFNGDGKEDVARLETQVKAKRVRVAVWLDGKKKPMVLAQEEMNLKNYLNLKSPGEVKAFDGLTEYNYKIILPLVSFGNCGTTERVYQWDAEEKKFASNWVSQ